MADAIKTHAIGLATQPKYQPGGNGDLNQRVRWDAFWGINSMIRGRVSLEIYNAGGNDSHLDTLLRSVFRSIRTLEQFAK